MTKNEMEPKVSDDELSERYAYFFCKEYRRNEPVAHFAAKKGYLAGMKEQRKKQSPSFSDCIIIPDGDEKAPDSRDADRPSAHKTARRDLQEFVFFAALVLVAVALVGCIIWKLV